MTRSLFRTRAVLEAGIADGTHLGAQVEVVHQGTTAAVCVGEARHGVPMTPGTVLPWFSAGKPVGAVAVAQLAERGLLAFDDPVARHVPEFAQNGKAGVTLRHLLTHTGGFRMFSLDAGTPPAEQVAAVCAAPLERGWVPGEKAGYHPRSSWAVLGEVVRRVDGRAFGAYARAATFEPLGMTDSWFGIPADTCRAYGDRLGTMFNTSKGPPDLTQPPPDTDTCAQATPGAGLRSTARDLARFYRMLVQGGELDGQRVLSGEMARTLVVRHRTDTYDHTFAAVMDWGLGFLLNRRSDQPLPYGYGPHASLATFGHSGAESSSAFCDPDNDLVVAWVCNGMPGNARHQARQFAVNRAVYEDLGIGSSA